MGGCPVVLIAVSNAVGAVCIPGLGLIYAELFSASRVRMYDGLLSPAVNV